MSSWTAAGGESLLDFIQAGLGYVYLTNLENTSGTTVVGSTGAVNSALTLGYTNDSTNTRISYTRNDSRLRMAGYCVVERSNQSVQLDECNGPSAPRAWNISVNGVIKNTSSGRCLHYDTGTTTLKTVTCPASPRVWTFVTDNNPLL